MIITDGIHLTSTSGEQELHDFAQKIGLKREWYQRPEDHGHYDLTTPGKKRRAVDAGAKCVTGVELVKTAWWTPFKTV
jgi:hypothetical protein